MLAKLLKTKSTNKASHTTKFAAIMNVDGGGTMPAIEDVQMEDAALDEIDTDATKKIDDCEETEGKIQREHRGNDSDSSGTSVPPEVDYSQ